MYTSINPTNVHIYRPCSCVGDGVCVCMITANTRRPSSVVVILRESRSSSSNSSSSSSSSTMFGYSFPCMGQGWPGGKEARVVS